MAEGGFVNWVKGLKSKLSRDVTLFNISEEKIVVDKLPFVPNWFFSAALGQPRRVDLVELRKYAKSPWVQMVSNTIIKQVKDTEWKVVSKDKEDEIDYSDMINKITDFLNFPNQNGDTFDDIWGAYLKDILEIDAGVIVKARSTKGDLLQLFAHDGMRFLIKMEEHGLIEGYYQYSIRHPSSAPKFFEFNDIVYGRVTMNTEFFPYGWSPLQSIQQEVEVLIQSTRYNKEFFKRNAIPDAIISAQMESEQMKRAKANWENEIMGKPHKLAWINSPIELKQLSVSNKDMEWLEGQKWYHHIVFAAYGLSPQEVGFYEKSSRATGESQERISIKNAIRPYLSHIADKINREIIPEFYKKPQDIPIEFKWFPTDHTQEKVEHDQTMDKLKLKVYSVNEVRNKEGLDPVEWGEKPHEPAPFTSPERPEEERETRPIPPRRAEEETTEERKSKIKKATEFEMEEEAVDYAEFLSKKFERWEEKILKAIDQHLKDEVPSEKKVFNDFIVKIFNTINTAGFKDKIGYFVGKHMKDGLNLAEEDLNMDIGISDYFRNRMKMLADQQIEGYNIRGKHWPGIKGVTRQLQHKIVQEVSESIRERKSLKDIKEKVKEIMAKEKGGEVKGKVTEGRTMKIARTEVTNMKNAGRLQAYQDSGVKGDKVWVTKKDNKVSDICQSLEGQRVGLFEPFIDFQGKEYMKPSSHPNCRCTIKMVVTETP